MRRGGEFLREHEMLGSACQWLYRQGLLVKEEYYTPWGVCDIVGVSLSAQRVKKRIKRGQRSSIGSLRRIFLLSQIPDSESGTSTSLGHLAADLRQGFSKSELQEELDRLVAGGFVEKLESGNFQKVNGWIPLHRRIVALELKLRRVEEALFQAASHLGFATESYVGLPEYAALRAAQHKADRFTALGVGLVAVGPARCKLLIRSRPAGTETDPVLQMHCVERFWRSHVIGS